MKYFEAPVPGGKISAEALRNVYDEVRRGTNFSVENGTLTKGVGGAQLNIEKREDVWARITAVGTTGYEGRYSWEQVEINAMGSGWVLSASGAMGAFQTNPAIESSFSTSIGIGKVVRLSGPFSGYLIGDEIPDFYIFSNSGGGGPENCPRVSNVTCTANMLVVTYQLACEVVPEPELQGNCPVGAPVGSILMWTQEPIPTGWLECNGGTFDPLDYPELFDLYGNNNLPDLRSAFIRGRGASAGALNPFGASNYPFKTARPSGASPFTTNTVADHTHSNGTGSAINTGGGGSTLSGYQQGTTGAAGSHSHTITSGGDNETVPEHRVLIYIVKGAT